jgi:chromosome partitioning protein
VVVDQIQYPRKHFAGLLGLSPSELSAADAHPELAPLGGSREVYGPRDLSAYRRVLGIHPPRQRQRRQLFLNFKGGTGKTSLSTAYAYRLAELGNRVLLVDLDSQGHASKCVGVEGEECEKTLFDILVKKEKVSDAVVHTPLAELDLVPSNLRMSTIDLALMPMSGREFKLRKALDEVQGDYDFVVFDAPPSFGLLNLNALIAADDLFVPVLADFLSFHGLKLLFETVNDIEEDLEHVLGSITIVINAYNPTTRIAREAKAALEEHYGEFLAKTVIRQCTQFAQASGEGVPIFAFDPACKGSVDLQALMDEVLPRLDAAAAKESA